MGPGQSQSTYAVKSFGTGLPGIFSLQTTDGGLLVQLQQYQSESRVFHGYSFYHRFRGFVLYSLSTFWLFPIRAGRSYTATHLSNDGRMLQPQESKIMCMYKLVLHLKSLNPRKLSKVHAGAGDQNLLYFQQLMKGEQKYEMS